MLQHGDCGYSAVGAAKSCAASPTRRSGASHAQDCSRSLAHGMTTVLPADHAQGPLAQDAADNAIPVLGGTEDKEWFTSDTVLDTWVLKSVDDAEVRAELALFSSSERQQIIKYCMRAEHTIPNMNCYCAGCIRKSVVSKVMRRTQTKSLPLFSVHTVEQVACPLSGTASPKCAEAWVAFGAPSAASAAVAPCLASPGGVPQAVVQAAAQTPGEVSAHSDASTQASLACTFVRPIVPQTIWMRVLCKQLEKSAAAELQALPPTEASQVGIARCLAWQAPLPVPSLCLRLVRNYRELQQSQPLPTTPATTSPSINFVILHLGGTGGVGHISMKAAFALVLKDLPAAKVSVLEGHVFVVGAQLREVEKAAASVPGVRCAVWSLREDFANVCSQQAATWGAKDCLVWVLINRDAVQAGSAVDAASRADAGGSSEPRAVRMSLIQQSLQSPQEHVPAKNLGVSCMHRVGASAADDDCLKSMLGAPHCVSCEGLAGPQLPGQVGTRPFLQTFVSRCRPLQAAGPDGWQWDPTSNFRRPCSSSGVKDSVHTQFE